MFKNDYSVLTIHGEKPLVDAEKAILDAQCRLWPVARCAESMVPEAFPVMSKPLWKFRLNTTTPPVSDVKALSEQIPGCAFTLDFGTTASCWRACLKYSEGKVIYWSAEVNHICGPCGGDGDGAAQRIGSCDDRPAAKVLREISESFYAKACSNIYGGIVEGIGLTTKERWSTDACFEAYEAIKEVLPDEDRAYLVERESWYKARLDTAKVGEHIEENSEEQRHRGSGDKVNNAADNGSGGRDDDWRREPFPPTPPLLADHPYVRIIQYKGFYESDFDPAQRLPMPLTRAEIRVLAQHHLDKIYQFAGFVKTGGSFGSSDTHRDYYHQGRFYDLAGSLPREDQEKFNEIIDIRKRYIETLRDPEEDEG